MLTRNMEVKSIIDEVQLRPLLDVADKDFFYPLYRRNSTRVMRAIRMIWCVLNVILDDDNNEDDDTRALHFMITSYAMWVYTHMFFRTEVAKQIDVLELARHYYENMTRY